MKMRFSPCRLYMLMDKTGQGHRFDHLYIPHRHGSTLPDFRHLAWQQTSSRITASLPLRLTPEPRRHGSPLPDFRHPVCLGTWYGGRPLTALSLLQWILRQALVSEVVVDMFKCGDLPDSHLAQWQVIVKGSSCQLPWNSGRSLPMTMATWVTLPVSWHREDPLPITSSSPLQTLSKGPHCQSLGAVAGPSSLSQGTGVAASHLAQWQTSSPSPLHNLYKLSSGSSPALLPPSLGILPPSWHSWIWCKPPLETIILNFPNCSVKLCWTNEMC